MRRSDAARYHLQAWPPPKVTPVRARKGAFVSPISTFIARRLAEHMQQRWELRRLVQLHPSFGYEDFVEGYRPVQSSISEDDEQQTGLALRKVDGPLRDLVRKAESAPTESAIMVLDEVNRGNLPRVFGELLFLLEYRDAAVSLMYSPDEQFRLPKNVLFIGTMNTADRSVAVLDQALRRRFHFVPLFPGEAPVDQMLPRFLAKHTPGMAHVAKLLDLANEQLPRNFRIGPSHLMRTDLDESVLEKVWKYSVLPSIAEHFFEREEELAALSCDSKRDACRCEHVTERVLRLREHDTLASVPLSAQEVALLTGSGARLQLVPVGPGLYDVSAVEIVGAVSLRGIRLVVEPKVPVYRLLALLAFSTHGITLRSYVPGGVHEDLLTIMQKVFATALDDALQRGLLHDYRAQEERLTAVRGRIDVASLHMRRFGVFPPIDCRFEDHVADVEPNRRLLAAALLLAQHRRGSSESVRLLGLASRMSDVTEVTYTSASLHPLALDRRWARYRGALTIAEIVLRHASVELEDGVAVSLGFLVNMNDLFEDVVVEGLRPLMSSDGRWARQPRYLHLDLDRLVPIYPDVVWSRRKQGPVIVDAKYKVTADAKREDLYQMTAYCQATGARRAVLVYADVQPGMIRVRKDGPHIEMVNLGLDCDVDVLRGRLVELAKALRAMPS